MASVENEDIAGDVGAGAYVENEDIARDVGIGASMYSHHLEGEVGNGIFVQNFAMEDEVAIQVNEHNVGIEWGRMGYDKMKERVVTQASSSLSHAFIVNLTNVILS